MENGRRGGFQEMLGLVMKKGGKEEKKENKPLVTLHEEGSEERIKALHEWIEQLCDPEENFCESLRVQLGRGWDAEVEQDAREEGVRRRVGSISLAGITGPEELELLEEEAHCESEGAVNIRRRDDTVFEGFYKDGLPHGFFRHLNTFGDLEFFGCFNRGCLLGVCWRSLPGGGFLVSRSWTFSGPNVIYLYPDCRTALVGTFQNCDVEQARLSEVKDCAGSVQGLVKVPLLSEPQGDWFTSQPATPACFCRNPFLVDPYERIFVQVGESRILRAGQGLFAKCDIEEGTVISFYNGVKVRPGQDTDRPTPYRMILDETSDLDMPDSVGEKLEVYRATLGHKACHSFRPNAETDVFYHPRFGLIRCIATQQHIRRGEEILIDYKYNLATAPAWYKISWAKHQKVVRGLPDWKTALRMANLPNQGGSRRASWAIWATDD